MDTSRLEPAARAARVCHTPGFGCTGVASAMASGGSAGASPRLLAFAHRTYGEGAAEALASCLAAVPELPLADRQDPERLTAAMLILGKGDRDGLARAIAVARRDWRDLLMAAGLANGNWPEVLARTLGPREA